MIVLEMAYGLISQDLRIGFIQNTVLIIKFFILMVLFLI